MAFGSSKVPAKRIRPYKPRSMEQRSALKADKLFWGKVKDNPMLEAAYIEKWLGIKIPIETPVERTNALIAAKNAEIQQRMLEVGAEELQNDPESSDIRRAFLIKSLGMEKESRSLKRPGAEEEEMGGDYGRYGYGPEASNDPDAMLEQIERLEAVKERLGVGKPTGMGALLTPENAGMLMGLVTAFLSSRNGGNPPAASKVYVVPYNGQMTEMTEDQYRAYMAQIPAALPVNMVNPPAVVPPVQSLETQLPGIKLPEMVATPPLAETAIPVSPNPLINQMLIQYWPMVTELQGYIDQNKQPHDYLKMVLEKSEKPDAAYQALFNYLSRYNYEAIMKLATPVRTDPALSALIQRLEAKKDWVVSLLEESAAVAAGTSGVV